MSTTLISEKQGETVDRSGVVFISIGHAGQLNPLMAIAETFRTKHPTTPITIITSQDLEAKIKSKGFGFVGIWKSSKFPQPMIDHFNISGIRDVEAMRQYTVWARGYENYDIPTQELTKWMSRNRPLMVICDVLSEAGMAAAIKTNTPYIINSPLPPYTSFADHLPVNFPPVGGGSSILKKTIWNKVYDIAVGFRYHMGLIAHIGPILKEHHEVRGIPRPEHFAKNSLMFLNDTSKLLCNPRVEWPENRIEWMGACISHKHAKLVDPTSFQKAWQDVKSEADSRDLINWIDAASTSGEPIVLVALGTLYKLDQNRVEAIYNALSQLPIKVIWKLSKDEQSLLPQEALSNTNFCIETWLPDLLLLLAHPKIELFINHAGGNSLHEGLYFGKKMVCLPAWMDCFDFAMRCQDAGAGLTIDSAPYLDENRLKSAVEKVLLGPEASTFTDNAKRVATDLQGLGGSSRASDVVWDFLQQIDSKGGEKVKEQYAVINSTTV